jgi:hypothetical protein
VLIWSISACNALYHERLVYDQRDIQVGIQPDDSTRKFPPAIANSHPARLTAEQIRTLLGSIQVTGWSGMIGGVIKDPSPIPLLNEEELRLVSQPLATALSQAGPEERVFFSIPNRAVPYNDDRTMVALFIRDPYLHLILQDHYAFLRADTAGGDDYKDPRDNKGMHLWLMRPAKAASLSPEETPRWGLFETVRISMKVQDVLAARASFPTAAQAAQANPPANVPPQASPPQPAPSTQALQTQPTPKGGPAAPGTAEPSEDLRLLIRELTAANLDLRERLKDQARDVQALKDELARLRQELTDNKAKTKSRRKPPAP